MVDQHDIEAERERFREIELAELLDFGGRRLRVSTQESQAVLLGLRGFEARVNAELGWNDPWPPGVFLVLAKHAPGDEGPAVWVMFAEIGLPDGIWQAADAQFGHPMFVLKMLTELLRHGARIPIPAGYGRAVGLVLAAQGTATAWARRARTLYGCDLDGRRYALTRFEGADSLGRVDTPVAYRRAVEGCPSDQVETRWSDLLEELVDVALVNPPAPLPPV